MFIDKEESIEWKHKEITRKTALRIGVLHNKLLFIKFTLVLWQAGRPKFWLYFFIYTQVLKSIFCLYMIRRYTHALSRNTEYKTIDHQVCFYRRCCLTKRVYFMHMVLEHINRTAWGVPNCSSRQSGPPLSIVSVLCHLLKAQHSSLSPNGCFNSPLALQSPPPPTPCPSQPPTPYILYSIRYITGTKKYISKTSTIYVNSL